MEEVRPSLETKEEQPVREAGGPGEPGEKEAQTRKLFKT